MSIIYEALKKAEKASSPSEARVCAPKPKHLFRAYLLSAAGLVFGIFAANMFFGFLVKGQVKEPSSQGQVSAESSPLPQPEPVQIADTPAAPVTEAPAVAQEQVSPTGGFTLNGIFFSQDAGLALINNQIVKAGDVINEATVREITSEEVVLEAQGNLIRLSRRNQP